MVQEYKDVEQALKESFINNAHVHSVDWGSYGSYGVLDYLPITGKANLLQYVIDGAMDADTGCFSPIRTEVYYAVGIFKSYCGVHIDESVNVTDVYDYITACGLLDAIIEAIPKKEKKMMDKLVYSTIADIARYNNSFSSAVQAMSKDSSELNNSMDEILDKIRNKEGLEVLDELKNMVGTD